MLQMETLDVELEEKVKHLSVAQKLALIETILQAIREDVAASDRRELSRLRRAAKRRTLAAAANELVNDYATDTELTIFTALDSEDFLDNGES